MRFFTRTCGALVALWATGCVLPDRGGAPALDKAPVNASSGGAPQLAVANGIGGSGDGDVTSDVSVTRGQSGASATSTAVASGGEPSTGDVTTGGLSAGGALSVGSTVGAVATGGACPVDASVGDDGAPSTIALPCERVTATCGERFYSVGGRCMRPSVIGHSNRSDSEVDGGLGYEPGGNSFRMNRSPQSVLAYKFAANLPASAKVVSLGAIADVDPRDPVIGGFRLALYDSDPGGDLPNQLIAETEQELSPNNPEECLNIPPVLAGGQYWLLLRVPSDAATVHLEATNVLSDGAPGIGFVDKQAASDWPSMVDWGARLVAIPPPPPPHPSLITATVPHVYLRYLPP